MKKEKSVTYVWFISYVIILIIPLVAHIVMYSGYNDVLKNEIEQTNAAIVTNKLKLVDDVIKNAESIAFDNAVKPELVEFSEYSSPLSAQNYYNIYKFIDSWFKYYSHENGSVVRAYIYLPKSDIIISNNCISGRRYFNTVYGGDEKEYEYWMQILTKKIENEYSIFTSSKNNSKTILYSYKMQPSLLAQIAPTVVVELNINAFEKLDSESESTNYYVIDSSSNLIYGSDDENWRSILNKESFNDDDKYVIDMVKSDDTGITCIFMKDKTEYMKKLSYIFILMLVCVILSGGIGICLIRLFVDKNSKPLKDIVKNISNGKEMKNVNEYQCINEALVDALKEKKKNDDLIDLQRKYLRRDLLYKICTNNDINEELIKSFGIEFKYDNFIMVLLSLEETNHFFFSDEDDNNEDVELATYAIENVFDESISRKYIHYIFTYHGVVHCIINCDSINDGVRHDIITVLEENRKFLNDNLNIDFVAAISGCCTDIYALPELYYEAKEILEYKYIYSNRNILESDVMIKDSNEVNYKYSLQAEQKLINYIKSGEYEKATEFFDRILEENVHSGNMSLPLTKCYVFDILCTLIKVTDEVMPKSAEYTVDKLDIYNRIVECTNINKVIHEVKDILYQFCNNMEMLQAHTKNKFLAEKAKTIVDVNYGDINLTITSIAGQLEITTNYLSTIFKREYKMTLYDYISVVRINKSKELLKNSAESIEKIAEKVGYSNDRTFSRTFSRMEGITPGKYRLL